MKPAPTRGEGGGREDWIPAPVSGHEGRLFAGMTGSEMFRMVCIEGEGQRGEEELVPATRFFVAEPPQNDMWDEGEGTY